MLLGFLPFFQRHLVLTRSSNSQPAIDVEARVADGHLGIGVFAPSDMLSEAQVDRVMDEMKSLMEGIF